jgi:hypothetical protein
LEPVESIGERVAPFRINSDNVTIDCLGLLASCFLGLLISPDWSRHCSPEHGLDDDIAAFVQKRLDIFRVEDALRRLGDGRYVAQSAELC